RREHQPGGGAGISAAAGAEHERKLGQSGAAHSDAHPRRYRQREPAAAARRNERRGRGRHRASARPAAGPVRAAGPKERRPLMADRDQDLSANRAAITACVSLATLMQALDTTIANVSLPHMQGSFAAAPDQIEWVLTSYITAAAIMTPPTGYLASRFGLKRLFLVAIAGFTVASMLCGAAQSLTQVVLFRILQGA